MTLGLPACRQKESDAIRVEVVPKELPPATAPAAMSATQDTNLNLANLPAGHPPIDLGGTGTTAAPSMAGPGGGMQALPGMAEFTAATPTPQWTVPADWTAVALTATRKGSWVAPAGAGKDQQAEISVTVFQGDLGGLLANVNRWRGKVGLSTDVTDAQLGQNVQTLTLDGRAAQLVSLDGPDGESLDGVLVMLPDKVWSLLLSGPTPAVKTERANFRAFLNSVNWKD